MTGNEILGRTEVPDNMLKDLLILLKIWTRRNVKVLNFHALLIIHQQMKGKEKNRAKLKEELLTSMKKNARKMVEIFVG